MRRRGAGLLFAYVGFLGACGTAAPYDYDPPAADKEKPLLTVSAYFKDAPPAGVARSYALIWFPTAHEKGAVQIAQNVSAREKVEVELAITHGPPHTAEDSGVSYERAELVVYEDVRANGRLDIVAGSSDRILARAPGVYFGLGPKPLGESVKASSGKTAIMDSGSGAPSSRYLANAPKDDTRCGENVDEKDQKYRPICVRTTPGGETTSVSKEAHIIISSAENGLLLKSYLCPGFWGTSSDRQTGWDEDACRAK